MECRTTQLIDKNGERNQIFYLRINPSFKVSSVSIEKSPSMRLIYIQFRNCHFEYMGTNSAISLHYNYYYKTKNCFSPMPSIKRRYFATDQWSTFREL